MRTGARIWAAFAYREKTGTLRPEANEGMTSWFMGFAPSQKPEIIVSVMLENGSVWRHKANELARDLLRNYFHGHGRPWVSDPLASTAAERVATSTTTTITATTRGEPQSVAAVPTTR